jgi:hypothetical protein
LTKIRLKPPKILAGLCPAPHPGASPHTGTFYGYRPEVLQFMRSGPIGLLSLARPDVLFGPTDRAPSRLCSAASLPRVRVDEGRDEDDESAACEAVPLREPVDSDCCDRPSGSYSSPVWTEPPAYEGVFAAAIARKTCRAICGRRVASPRGGAAGALLAPVWPRGSVSLVHQVNE